MKVRILSRANADGVASPKAQSTAWALEWLVRQVARRKKTRRSGFV